MPTPPEKVLVMRLGGRWTDWLKVLLGLVAVAAPELLAGTWPVLGLEDTAGLALLAAGLWAVFQPAASAPQWLALAAAAALVVWPSMFQPTMAAAPWIGILAGFLGAVTAVMRLREIRRLRREGAGDKRP